MLYLDSDRCEACHIHLVHTLPNKLVLHVPVGAFIPELHELIVSLKMLGYFRYTMLSEKPILNYR